ncbi:MAG: AraC family transcriptional regulator [Roseburia sp.]|nr:AraC family transcriptional regulator [Roseburia sp.]MCM1097094.1 AraC family transcriptional regulator [Ruminococcus flavefaciens]
MSVKTNLNTPPNSKNLGTFNDANSDIARPRILTGGGQEIVQYRQDTLLRIWYNDIAFDYSSHWHAALEVIVPMENWYDAAVGGESFHISPGDIFFIPPGELHALKAPETGSRFVFMFDLSAFTRFKGFAGLQPILSSPIHMTRATYPNIYDDVYQILVQMRNEYFAKNEFAELTIYSLLLNMLVKLGVNHLESIDLFPNMRVYKQKEYVDKFNSVMDYIDTHYTENLNLEEIASTFGFSKYHFSRLFKQYTNYTFCNYLSHRRIKIAEELLALPGLSVTEVALQAGFPSISTFNRVFRQVKGCSPSEYREKNQFLRVRQPDRS